MPAPRLLVFPDCGPRIGGGHVMRSLTLARALAARGGAVAFAANPAAQGVLSHFGGADLTVFPVSDDLQEAAPAAAAWAGAFHADWVLLDHYRLDAAQEQGLGERRRLAVLDDLADRPRAADLLLDPGYGRRPEDYRGLVPEGARVLAGPAYAAVRPEFAAARPAALRRREAGSHLSRVLVSLGLTDVEGITGRVLAALRPAFPELLFEVVVGDAAPSLAALRQAAKADPGLRLHVDSRDMGGLMAGADLAVGAGGGAVWERATVGLPAVTVILADNQRPMIQAMGRDRLTLAVEAGAAAFGTDLVIAVQRLIDGSALRRDIARRTSALCDGRGAERFAQILCG